MNIGGRYAKALFQIAAQQKKIDRFMEELDMIRRLFDESGESRMFFEDKLMKKEQKIDIMTKLCTRMDVSEQTQRLILLLINVGREMLFDDIVRSYEQMYNDYKGIIKVDVYTAYDLGSGEVDTLKARIKEMFKKDPVMNIVKDDTIIGGVKMKVGWTIYDGTIKTHLKDFTDSLKI